MPFAPPPSSAEYRTGGVDGAIARFSEAVLRIEKRERAAWEEIRREERGRGQRPYTVGELRAMTTASGSGIGLIPQNGAPMYVAELFADAARTKARLAPKLFQGQLPDRGMQVVVGKTTTGAAMAQAVTLRLQWARGHLASRIHLSVLRQESHSGRRDWLVLYLRRQLRRGGMAWTHRVGRRSEAGADPTTTPDRLG